MKLSEGKTRAATPAISGNWDHDFSWMGHFSSLANSPANPRLIRLIGEIQKGIRSPSDTSRAIIENIIQFSLSLFGDTSCGLGVCKPPSVDSIPNLSTMVIQLAHLLSQFALETDAIDDVEFRLLSEVYSKIDCQLIHMPPSEWPELAQIPPRNNQILFHLHYDLFQEPIYDLVAPFWQQIAFGKLNSGLLIAPSSMSAFLTPLRQFARHFPRDLLPNALYNMDPADREGFSRRIKDFFDDQTIFTLSQRTRDDYASVVRLAFGIAPRQEDPKIWTWKYHTHVSRLDNDPPEENGDGDGYTLYSYLAAVRQTAESMDDETTLSLLPDHVNSGETISGNDGLFPIPQSENPESISTQELRRIHHYSADRYAMAGFHSPFDQCSLSMHVICVFDHWLSNQKNAPYQHLWPLLFHLLLVTGRNLDWVLSIHFNASQYVSDHDTPIYDSEKHSILTETMLKLDLPQMISTDPVYAAYLPTTHQIAIPVCAKAAGWIEEILALHRRTQTEPALFVHPDGTPITRQDVLELLLHPFMEYLLCHQPGLPAMTLGRIRRAFWNLFTWQGLSPEDATMISDQYYLDVRAPMFYACRSVPEFRSAYQRAYIGVGQALLHVYGGLFPRSIPMTFSIDPNPFIPSDSPGELHYGSCYCPQEEKLHQLCSAIINNLKEEWQKSSVHTRYNQLTSACAFGISLGLGLRVGEAAGLTFPSIDLPARTIAVDGKVDRFAEEMRILPIPLPLRAPLSQLIIWRTRLGVPDDAHSSFFQIFQGQSSIVPLSRERLWRQLRRWETDAGLEEAMFRWHALRHALASYLQHEGTMTFPERSYFLGHAAGQQWLSDLRPGEQQTVFDRFAYIVSGMMNDLGFDLSEFSIDS